jgi:hypothetical protein
MAINHIIINFSGLVTFDNGDKASLQGGYDENKSYYSETEYEEEGYNATYQILWSDPVEGDEPLFPLESYPWHNRLKEFMESISTKILDFAEIPSSVFTKRGINDMVLRLNVVCAYTPDSNWSSDSLNFAILYQDHILQCSDDEASEEFGTQLRDDLSIYNKFNGALNKAMQFVELTVH